MKQTLDTPPDYYEEQAFRQWWLRILVLFAPLFLAVLFGYGMNKQLVLGQPWGNQPMSNTALVVVASLTLLVTAVPAYLFLAMKLITEVRPDGLRVGFAPFFRKSIAFEDIQHCQARTYRPIAEYGGWGIRWGRKAGKAYNVSGNRGVQLELSGGQRLLIGSQRADDLADAINAHLNPDRPARSE
jgi:hypothetical protein